LAHCRTHLGENGFLRDRCRARILHINRTYNGRFALGQRHRWPKHRRDSREKHRHRPAPCRSPKFSHNKQDAESRAALKLTRDTAEIEEKEAIVKAGFLRKW